MKDVLSSSRAENIWAKLYKVDGNKLNMYYL